MIDAIHLDRFSTYPRPGGVYYTVIRKHNNLNIKSFKDNNFDSVQNKSLSSWMNASLLNFSNLEFHLSLWPLWHLILHYVISTSVLSPLYVINSSVQNDHCIPGA